MARFRMLPLGFRRPAAIYTQQPNPPAGRGRVTHRGDTCGVAPAGRAGVPRPQLRAPFTPPFYPKSWRGRVSPPLQVPPRGADTGGGLRVCVWGGTGLPLPARPTGLRASRECEECGAGTLPPAGAPPPPRPPPAPPVPSPQPPLPPREPRWDPEPKSTGGCVPRGTQRSGHPHDPPHAGDPITGSGDPQKLDIPSSKSPRAEDPRSWGSSSPTPPLWGPPELGHPLPNPFMQGTPGAWILLPPAPQIPSCRGHSQTGHPFPKIPSCWTAPEPGHPIPKIPLCWRPPEFRHPILNPPHNGDPQHSGIPSQLLSC